MTCWKYGCFTSALRCISKRLKFNYIFKNVYSLYIIYYNSKFEYTILEYFITIIFSDIIVSFIFYIYNIQVYNTNVLKLLYELSNLQSNNRFGNIYPIKKIVNFFKINIINI